MIRDFRKILSLSNIIPDKGIDLAPKFYTPTKAEQQVSSIVTQGVIGLGVITGLIVFGKIIYTKI